MRKAKTTRQVTRREDPRDGRRDHSLDGLDRRAQKGARRAAEEMTVPATRAKNEFASVLEAVLTGNRVVITKHDQPKAVLISIEEFNRLSDATGIALDSLAAEFDALLAGMQTPKARAAMRSAFHASPSELGRAAVAAARKRAGTS